MRCFYRYLHKSINLPMAQTSNAIDRRFSTPYYTNTNYSYIKSKPNGAFSAASCFGRSGCWGRGGGGGVLTAWLGSAYWFGSHCLRRVITPLLFLGESRRQRCLITCTYTDIDRRTHAERIRVVVVKEEVVRRRERKSSSSTTQTAWCTSTAVFHKIGRQKYLWICLVLKDWNRKREKAE